MIKVLVKNINFGEKTVLLEKGSINELVEKLNTNDDSVVFINKNGEIFTEDRKLRDGDEINVVEVFSGG